MKKIILTAFAVAWCSTNALASEKVDGTFEAVRDCEAYTSFKKGSNPGLVKLHAGEVYEAVEVNKAPDWDWIRVSVGAANGDLRWVAKGCGYANIEPPSPTPGPGSQPACSTPNQYDSYVLALSWQPGFCEHPPHPDKPECAAMEKDKISISHLTLHGLWPNKNECGTRYGDCSDTPLDLTEDTVAEMAPWMPNFYFSMDFATHEWSKHGTCQERDDDTYFLLAKDILQRVDKSAIGSYLRDSIGETINTDEYRQYIEDNLGKEVADRMQLVCSKKKYLQEIRINLPKELVADDDIAKMLSGAKTFGKFTSKCSGDIYIERSGKN